MILLRSCTRSRDITLNAAFSIVLVLEETSDVIVGRVVGKFALLIWIIIIVVVRWRCSSPNTYIIRASSCIRLELCGIRLVLQNATSLSRALSSRATHRLLESISITVRLSELMEILLSTRAWVSWLILLHPVIANPFIHSRSPFAGLLLILLDWR